MSLPTGRWFIAASPDWNEDRITLDPEESHHAVDVLRVAPSDVIAVTDGLGTVARCSVISTESTRLVAEVLEVSKRERGSPELVVYQGAAKAGKADSVVERLAELGVAEVWVFESERTVARWNDSKRAKLEQRWRSIARSVAKQSRNPWMIRARVGASWAELVERVATEPSAVVLWEQATAPLRRALEDSAERVALVVGPEGGLSRAEADALSRAGASPVSLGPTILRTENAAVVAAAAILYHHGRLG